jgi:hypothetical protein
MMKSNQVPAGSRMAAIRVEIVILKSLIRSATTLVTVSQRISENGKEKLSSNSTVANIQANSYNCRGLMKGVYVV